MKMHCFSASAVVLAFCFGPVLSQTDCTLPTNNDIATLIVSVLQSGHDLNITTIDVTDFQLLCLAYSEEQNRYRYFSVLVEYTCIGNTNCPSGTAIEQLDSQCNSGVWGGVGGNFEDIRTQDPIDTSSTFTREDCALCISPDLISILGIPIVADNETHCVGELY